MESIFLKNYFTSALVGKCMLFDTHNYSGGKSELSFLSRVIGCKKVENGIGKSGWNNFFSIDPDLLFQKTTGNHM